MLIHRLKVTRGTPKLPQIRSVEGGTHSPVSIIVPARNEEAGITSCLSSLSAQSYPDYEVIVVDDSSTDRTSEIAEKFAAKDARFKVVRLSSLKEGWVGKNWACHNGLLKARGELLLFTDADTMIAPDTLHNAVDFVKSKRLDLLTLIPTTECKGFWAKTILPTLIGIIMTLFSPLKVNDRTADTAYLFGSFFLVSRRAYLRIGGHKAIRGSIVEDRALGERAKRKGLNLLMASAGERVKTTWSEGFASNWQALLRVISSSVRSNPLRGFAFAILASVAMLSPYALTVGLVFSLTSQPASLLTSVTILLAGSAIVMMLLAFGYEVSNTQGPHPIFTMTQPLSSLLFIMAIIATSMKAIRGGKFVWKGRGYQ